jgi:C_GCAxxG_C_C family probable redox protein
MSQKTEKAMEYFKSGYNCAQSVLAPFAEEYGLDEEDALRASGAMGRGARVGELCGAVNGGVVVVGLKYGQTAPGDAGTKVNCAAKTQEVMDKFTAKNGKLRCSDLLGLDVNEPGAPEKIAELGLGQKICRNLVTSAVEILEELGY